MSKRCLNVLLVLPSIAGVAVFWAVPFLRLILSSFFQSQTGAWNGFGNYMDVMGSQSFRLAAANTLKFMLISIPVMLVLSLAIAVFLSEKSILNMWLKESVILPLVMPAAAVSVFCGILFDSSGFEELLFIYIWKYTGLYMLVWLSGIANVPLELKDAAYLDGAGEFRYIKDILLPNLKQVGFICFVFMFINSFKVFREIYLMTGSYPDENIYMLQHIFNNWYKEFSVDKMSAGAVLSAVSILLFLLAVFMLLDKGRRRDG